MATLFILSKCNRIVPRPSGRNVRFDLRGHGVSIRSGLIEEIFFSTVAPSGLWGVQADRKSQKLPNQFANYTRRSYLRTDTSIYMLLALNTKEKNTRQKTVFEICARLGFSTIGVVSWIKILPTFLFMSNSVRSLQNIFLA